MAIKATFPLGVDTITLNTKLHQWDYGQTLEIEAMDLSPLVEVHFACHGMEEAEVRPCSTTNGVTTVTIPDRCLEQSSNITAWVFEIDGTRGMTTKTITIPVIARTKPSNNGAVPEEFVDCYTELISEVNEAIKLITDGNVTAKYAHSAGSATSANTAGTANSLAMVPQLNEAKSLSAPGLYYVFLEEGGTVRDFGVMYWNGKSYVAFPAIVEFYDTNRYFLYMRIGGDGKFHVYMTTVNADNESNTVEQTNAWNIYVAKIGG